MGYHRAGFEVVGIDIEPQPNYPFEFYQADAVQVLSQEAPWIKMGFDAIHASPPCQAYTQAQRLQGNDHPDLVGPVRDGLVRAGLPYVIENVVGAPLIGASLLCGTMFPGLRTYRHRLFECSFPLVLPYHGRHVHRQVKMGRKPLHGEWIQVVGNFSGVEQAKEAMGIDWMTRKEMAEAIPPTYTEYVGRQLREFCGSDDRKHVHMCVTVEEGLRPCPAELCELCRGEAD